MISGMRIRSAKTSCGGQSLFSVSPFSGPEEERVMPAANGWSADGLIGLPGMGLGTAQQKRIIGDTNVMVQDNIGVATSVSRHPSLPVCQTYASSMRDSLSRNTVLDSQVVRSHSPCISAPRVRSMEDGRNVNVPNLYNDVSAECENLVDSLSGLNLSSVGEINHSTPPPLQDDYQNFYHLQTNSFPIKQNYYYSNENLNGPFTPTLHGGGRSPSQYLNPASPTSSLPNYNVSGRYPPALPLVVGNNIPPLQQETIGMSRINASILGRGGMALGSNLLPSSANLGNFARYGDHRSRMGLMGSSYPRSNEYSAATLSDMRNYGESIPNSQVEYLALQRAAYSDALLPMMRYGPAFVKPTTQNNDFHGNSAFGYGFPCPGNPMGSPTLPNSAIGSDGPFRQMTMHSPSNMRNIAGNFTGPWPSEFGYNLEETHADSLLDEFKESKIRCFKLSEIAGHVVEFSADQYGSRLIQQKLETASAVEKNMVFHEIMPDAFSLMTDVFGNYVIQKFFECGSPSQIRQLADQLIGHVLTLSLQMYGCRVIQKAIEVVELDQLTKMVAELDGHIMRCVRDQNGNHVIQKCIEYVPEGAIQFIVTTFYDQAVTLSCHPFGCRVIQRVLEHCHNPNTLNVLMNEILRSVCVLSQDQYGNYVIQHLLEHGKPHERSIIIRQLIGKIVEMSQQKFASNVIEKCFSFGTPEERQTLVFEMLGNTNENEPLQVMMKDQFANYVVQKVLETCDDQLLELLLKRMKVHLNTLKKYTYGKHIVARIEKLVAAGESRISILSTISA